MNKETKQTNPRKLYWIALAIYTVAAVVFAMLEGDHDYIRHMGFLMIFFISGNVYDIRLDILRIKERLENNPEAIDAEFKPVE